jgi:hypothetical protein
MVSVPSQLTPLGYRFGRAAPGNGAAPGQDRRLYGRWAHQERSRLYLRIGKTPSGLSWRTGRRRLPAGRTGTHLATEKYASPRTLRRTGLATTGSRRQCQQPRAGTIGISSRYTRLFPGAPGRRPHTSANRCGHRYSCRTAATPRQGVGSCASEAKKGLDRAKAFWAITDPPRLPFQPRAAAHRSKSPTEAGCGLAWDKGAVENYRIVQPQKIVMNLPAALESVQI